MLTWARSRFQSRRCERVLPARCYLQPKNPSRSSASMLWIDVCTCILLGHALWFTHALPRPALPPSPLPRATSKEHHLCEEPECADCFVAFETAEELRRHHLERHSGAPLMLAQPLAGPALGRCVVRAAQPWGMPPTRAPARRPAARHPPIPARFLPPPAQPACRAGTPAARARCSWTSPTPAGASPPRWRAAGSAAAPRRAAPRTCGCSTPPTLLQAAAACRQSSGRAAVSGLQSMSGRRMAG